MLPQPLSPRTTTLPIPAVALPRGEGTIPPAPPAATMPVPRQRPGRRALRSIAFTVPIAAGLALLAGRLIERARSAADEPGLDHGPAAIAARPAPESPPAIARSSAPSIEPVISPPAQLPSGLPPPPEVQPHYVVRGVIAPDTLNVRQQPDPRSAAVVRIPADARGIVASGKRRQIGASAWWEVTYRGRRGWVNGRFLAAE
jgi:hypothetical protein